MKEFLSENHIKFAYLDISDSMFNLKQFLKYRDNHPQFEEVKENNRVGIPCIVINNGEKIIIDSKPDLEDLK